MSVLESAIELAKQKVRFFPISPNSKIPPKDMTDFSRRATSDPKELEQLFSDSNLNSGIACGKVDEDLYLVGLDIDYKPSEGKNGYPILEAFAELGLEFPDTWSQKTPSGGEHRLFWSKVPIRQGINVIGPDLMGKKNPAARGIDLRGDGGYLVGPGSAINGELYRELRKLPIAMWPEWATERYAKPSATVIELRPDSKGTPVQDQVLALKRSIAHLQSLEFVTQGSRNQACYQAICVMKDFGLDKTQMPDVLNQFWKCDPMLDDHEILITINSAFKTGKNDPGVLAPENVFDIVEPQPKKPTEVDEEDFIDKMNQRFFFCQNRVYEERERDGKLYLQKHSVEGFHNLMLPQRARIAEGEKLRTVQKSENWMSHTKRRTYTEIRFVPRDDVPKDVYNRWQGFHTKPAPEEKVYPQAAHIGRDLFIEHVRENICEGSTSDFNWLMNFAAHLFQKPWEKPHVAVVFQGLKGTGKNTFVDVLHHMIGTHSVTIAGKHSMSSHFNSILEDKLLIALDEAFWSGDKGVEGILKSTVTDSRRVIERKGEEPYTTTVYDRIFILGNEEQLVNATSDERRYAVFNVSPARRGDTRFFGALLDGMRIHGGDEILMAELLKRDISKFDIRQAPSTQGLIDQKAQSLTTLELWWQDCLMEGHVLGHLVEEEDPVWPTHMLQSSMWDAYFSYLKANFPNKYREATTVLGKKFKKVSETCSSSKVMRVKGRTKRIYEFDDLDMSRIEWNLRTGLNVNWE